MSDRNRIVLLIVVMLAVAAVIGASAIGLLYRTAFRQTEHRLIESAQSQARLMEAIARHDRQEHEQPRDPFANKAIQQIRDAHRHYRGLGESGEFTLAYRDGERMVFLLRHRHTAEQQPTTIPFHSPLAEPMRRALDGHSGTMVGLDCRGMRVLAAYEPVALLNLGIVAKIDLWELRRPFILAGLLVLAVGTLSTAIGTWLFIRIGQPLVARITASERRYQELVETIPHGVMQIGPAGEVQYANRAAHRLWHVPEETLVGRPLAALAPEAQRGRLQNAITHLLTHHPPPKPHPLELRLADESRHLQLDWNYRRDEAGDVAGLVAILSDITPQTQAARLKALNHRRLEAQVGLQELRGASLTRIMDFILQHVVELTESRLAFVGFINRDETEMETFLWSAAAMEQCHVQEAPTTFPIAGAGFWAESVRRRAPVMENDFHLPHPNKKGLPPGHMPLTRFLSVPVVDEGQVVMLAAVANKAAPYGEDDQRQLALLVGGMWQHVKQRRGEAALREREEEIRLLLESTGEGLIGMDREHRCTLVNPAALAMLGYPGRSALLGRDVHRLIHHAHSNGKPLDEEQCRITLAMREGRGITADDEVFWRADGTSFPVEYRSFPLMREGQVVGVVLSFTDITSRLATMAELEQELGLNKALAQVAGLLITTGATIPEIARLVLRHAQALSGAAHGFVSEVDPASGDCLSHTLTDMMGGQCRVEGSPTRFPRGADGAYGGLWGHALNTRAGFICNDPARHPSAKGVPEGHLPLENFLAQPVLFGGERVGLIALANTPGGFTQAHLEDVARLAELYALAIQRERLEQGRQRMERQLRQAQKLEAIGTLTGGIAHDFNNILGVIIGYTDLGLGKVSREERVHHYLTEIFKAGARARDLVAQLLTFSRQGETEPHPLRLAPIVKEVLKFLRSTVNRAIDIRLTLKDPELVVMGDPTRLHQIIMNLATNACHELRERGGELEVVVESCRVQAGDLPPVAGLAPGEYAMLVVRDNGPGIAPAVMEHLFDPFFTTKKVGEGTGLGLSVVHGIVTGLGGAVGVESQPGQGATFRVCLPRVLGEAAEAAATEETPSPPGKRRQGRIVVVDDEPALVAIAQEELASLGYQVEGFDAPERALARIREAPANLDLLITDQAMPHMNGLELVREARAVRPDLPVLICTGFGSLVDEGRARGLGVRQVLIKPLTTRELRTAVDALLAPEEKKGQQR